MKVWLKVGFYLSASVMLVFSLAYDHALPFTNNRVTGGYGGKFKYLTHLNLWMQPIYYGLLLVAGLLTLSYENKERKGKLHTICDVVHACLAFPVGMFVCLVFWMIYAVDRELVYPKELDKVIPQWLNHIMHTVHIPLLLVDKHLIHHKYPPSKIGYTVLFSSATLYQLWILYLAYAKDIWVYPVLEVLSLPARICFFAALWGAFLMLYHFGKYITDTMWGAEMRIDDGKRRKASKRRA